MVPYVASVGIPETQSVTKRAAILAAACCDWIASFDLSPVCIEDYAFNATGRVFHIGENTGILKHYLDLRDIKYIPVPPTVIKKFATGKGNADKYKMVDAFLTDYPAAHGWIPKFFPRYKPGAILAKSPLSDLADAYWIAKYATSNGIV
jgi:Holliday junction resolvasome RuvABC endonuclease subunit